MLGPKERGGERKGVQGMKRKNMERKMEWCGIKNLVLSIFRIMRNLFHIGKSMPEMMGG